MPEMRAGFNSRQQPVVLDAAGHILGGGEHGVYDPNQPRAQHALTQGWLIDMGPQQDVASQPDTPAVDDVGPSPENVPGAQVAAQLEQAEPEQGGE